MKPAPSLIDRWRALHRTIRTRVMGCIANAHAFDGALSLIPCREGNLPLICCSLLLCYYKSSPPSRLLFSIEKHYALQNSLTPDVTSIDALLHDHHAVLAKSAGGAVAVFANNAPAFYAVTPARLAELLALEEKPSRPGSDVTLDDQFYEEPQAAPVAVPMGKFCDVRCLAA